MATQFPQTSSDYKASLADSIGEKIKAQEELVEKLKAKKVSGTFKVKIPEDDFYKNVPKKDVPSGEAAGHISSIIKHLIEIRRELELAQGETADIAAPNDTAEMSVEEILAILGDFGDILDELDPQMKAVLDMLREIIPDEQAAAKENGVLPEESEIADIDDDLADWIKKAQKIEKEDKYNGYKDYSLDGWYDRLKYEKIIDKRYETMIKGKITEYW